MNCGRVSNQLSAYVDRELTGVEMLSIRNHLDDCDACRSEYEALCRMKMLLGRLREPELTPEFVSAALYRWEGSERWSMARRWPMLESLSESWTGLRESISWRLAVMGIRRVEGFRPRISLTTAGLTAALVLTGVVLHRPRNADSLIAHSPIAVLEGEDPLSHPAITEWNSLHSQSPGPLFASPSGSQPTLEWVNVSLQGDATRSFR